MTDFDPARQRIGLRADAVVESDRVTLLCCQAERIDTPSASGKGQQVHRCPACRVALWSHCAGSGEAVSFVRVGTLDTPDALPLDAVAVTAFSRRSEHWPPESFARLKALRASPPSAETPSARTN